MQEDARLTLKVLEDASELIDEQEFPGTSGFIKDLQLLAEHCADPSGNIEANRLALSLVSTVGYLESRINDVEAALKTGRPEENLSDT